ncbi:class I SAM-dependent methyltransferase [Jatrophihabitans sp. YIM 134969]
MADEVYDRIGVGYHRGRRPDPRWQLEVDRALDDARTVVNVGAGTGSYESPGRTVLAVEPSSVMIAQRPPGAALVVRGVAEHLPVATDGFDVATAFATLHHWPDWRAGLAELRRVARRVVVVHFDSTTHANFWLVEHYLPEMAEAWGRVASLVDVSAALGERVEVRVLPVPWDCVDGFVPAYWRRPEAYLDPSVRAGMSGFALLDPSIVERGISDLRADLSSGRWHRTHADLLELSSLDVGWRLIVADRQG